MSETAVLAAPVAGFNRSGSLLLLRFLLVAALVLVGVVVDRPRSQRRLRRLMRRRHGGFDEG